MGTADCRLKEDILVFGYVYVSSACVSASIVTSAMKKSVLASIIGRNRPRRSSRLPGCFAGLPFDLGDRFPIEGIADCLTEPFNGSVGERDECHPAADFDDSISVVVLFPDLAWNDDPALVVRNCRLAHENRTVGTVRKFRTFHVWFPDPIRVSRNWCVRSVFQARSPITKRSILAPAPTIRPGTFAGRCRRFRTVSRRSRIGTSGTLLISC